MEATVKETNAGVKEKPKVDKAALGESIRGKNKAVKDNLIIKK